MLLPLWLNLGRRKGGGVDGFYLEAYNEYVRDTSKHDSKRWKALREQEAAANEQLRELLTVRDELKAEKVAAKPVKRTVKAVKKKAKAITPLVVETVSIDVAAIEREIAAINMKIDAHVKAMIEKEAREYAMQLMRDDEDAIAVLMMGVI